ncbi:MAG: phosphate ABC transporter substrate-binding protein [Limnochordaceae bacterium]|nr:phosphate ABC transporter substrate-binding protein [Limnochordaceae bacterium]
MKGAWKWGAPLLLLAALEGWGSHPAMARQALTIKGSDTMVILGQRWAEQFARKNPDIAVQVTGGGSGSGIAALINGTTDIAEASRPMTAQERALARQRRGKEVHEFVVAKDGVTVYVNEANPVEALTVDQLRGIFTGRIRRWSEVGGLDQPIIVYSREHNSGTYVFFREHVMQNEDYTPRAQTMPGTAALVNAVARTPNGIGFGGIAYAHGVRAVRIRAHEGAPAVAPSLETVRNGTYPLSRPLYWYTLGEPGPLARQLLDWVLSDEGQAVVAEVGYIPLR